MCPRVVMMIRITDTPKTKDRVGSIPIREGKPRHGSASGPHPPRRRPQRSALWNWLKRVVILFLCLAIFLGLGSILLIPYLATDILPKQLAAALNRPVTIARAAFNPLTCSLTLHQLIVGPKLSQPDDPVDPLLSASGVSIACEPKRLLEGDLTCTLAGEHLFVHLVRQKDGAYNLGQALDDLLPALPILPLRFSWTTIALSNSRLVFDDEQAGKVHLAEEITLAISPGQPKPFRLQARINGISIALPDPASPSQAATPPPGAPEATEPGESTNAPAAPDDAAAKTAEAIALVQELSQEAGEYLQNPFDPPVERRPSPLTP